MKRFSNYITELFDSKVQWSEIQSGGTHWKYRFTFLNDKYEKLGPHGQDLIPQPSGKQELTAWWNARGFTPSKLYQMQSKDEYLMGVLFEVNFGTISSFSDYSKKIQAMNGVGIYELGFGKTDAVLTPSPHAMGGEGIGLYWKYDTNFRSDETAMSSGDAVKVFSTIADISKEFVKKAKPRGVLFGTKMGVKDSRRSVYEKLAKRLATEMGGKFYDLKKQKIKLRKNVDNGMLVWFDKTSEPFDK